tara:strand:+ start:5689 stop:6699 length:1011 start_codon:yes stop_codon:yes gene_type:complete
MAKHVFVGVATGTAANFALNVSTTFAGAAGIIGIWNPDQGTGGDYLNGTGTEKFVTSAGALAAGLNRFQVVQGTTNGYPYATGLLESMRVKSVRSQMYLVSAKATTTAVTIVQQALKVGSFKIVKKAMYSDYNEFLSPTGDYDDRVDQIRNYSFSFGANLAATTTAIAKVVNDDLGAFVSAVATGTQITLSAKDNGTSFQVIDTSVLLDATNGIAMSTWGAALAGSFGFTEGSGNGWQAIMAEKKSLHHKAAYHNRTSFPYTEPEMFAVAAGTYDVVTVHLDGGIRQDATNAKDDQIVELYLPAGWTDAGTGVIENHFTGLASASAAGLKQIIYTK